MAENCDDPDQKLRRDLWELLGQHGLNRKLASDLIRVARIVNHDSVLVRSLLSAACKDGLDPPQIEQLLRQAGYAPTMVRLVTKLLELPTEAQEGAVESLPSVRDLIALVDRPDEELVALVRAWQSAGEDETSARKKIAAVLRHLDKDGLDPPQIEQLLRQAGYAPTMVRLVTKLLELPTEAQEGAVESLPSVRDLIALVDRPDEELVALVRAWQSAGEDETSARKKIAAVLRHLDKDGLDPPQIEQLLRQAGYAPTMVRLVTKLLELPTEAQEGAVESLPSVRDLIALVDRPDEELVALVRAWQSAGEDETSARKKIAAVLRHLDKDGLDPPQIEQLLRQAGYAPTMVRLVTKLLELPTEAQEGAVESLPSVRDLIALVDRPDEELVALVRAWQSAGEDETSARKKIAAVLRHLQSSSETVSNLASMITDNRKNGKLGDLARIGRNARSIEDSCITMAEPSWSSDPQFTAAYNEARKLAAWGRDIRWRTQILVKMAGVANHLKGDFVECGVDTGGTARVVMAYLGDRAFARRKFFLFDTFRGVVKEQQTDAESTENIIRESRYPDVYNQALSNFADKPYVRIVQGIVPATLPSYRGKRVAYLHIDMNVALPEAEALKFFWPKLVPGAPVIFDDYGFPRHHAQRALLDSIANELGVEIIMLPTCQGFLFKPPQKGLINKITSKIEIGFRNFFPS